MSAELEKLAAYYAQQGDKDIERILRNTANMSRSRHRPEQVLLPGLLLSRDERDIHFSSPDILEQPVIPHGEIYYNVQTNIVDTFGELAPAEKDKRYTYGESIEVMGKFRDTYGKSVPDWVALAYLVMPMYPFPTLLSPGHHRELRHKMTRIDSYIRGRWNRTFNQLDVNTRAQRRGKYVTVGEVRDMPDEAVLAVKNIGRKDLQVFRTALSP